MSTPDKIPLIESYGPVMQGEGLLIGRPTWFVRLGGCDYRCHFCDSMHAVDPREIDKRKRVLSAHELGIDTLERMGSCPMVTLSGGNPALWDLDGFVRQLYQHGRQVAIETQGSVYKPWIATCNYVTVSPKGPGMIDDWQNGLVRLVAFMDALQRDREMLPTYLRAGVTLKVPIFDEQDLEFCREVRKTLGSAGLLLPRLYLSVGNLRVSMLALKGEGEIPDIATHRNLLMFRYEALFEQVMEEFPDLADCAILPQMHVLLYGSELGR